MRAPQALVVLIACTLVAGQPIKQDHLKQPAETVRDLKEIESADAATVAARFVFDHFGNSPGEDTAQEKRPPLYLTARKKQALDVVANDLSATADLVKKSTKFSFSDKDFFGMSSNGAGVSWGRSVPATKDEKRHANVGNGSPASSGSEGASKFGFGPNGDGVQWGWSPRAIKDDKRHANVGNGSPAPSGNAGASEFGFGPNGDGVQWGSSPRSSHQTRETVRNVEGLSSRLH
ncbi:unnamed protein product [Tilletia controversa]|uniref:Uncharacterized protein n=3 Tax=Tilletia TaxID=13289 RepID=A0A8X7MKH1_9BASI|nr:hypothetical protein CF328_g7860 [Tilletia controversa]KAE8185370.1 hypothetical protein CF335_g7740 [Tilletia laevis]KAE8251704.1 hypothetical protein A4X03_0g6333 [Tilletia caries]KAE8189044.1 hypothetical protein CF336_g5909 [Tilletia laevis]KAE8238770.1 hypothetical protein A4X06_0g8632 [Tilletia controversa]